MVATRWFANIPTRVKLYEATAIRFPLQLNLLLLQPEPNFFSSLQSSQAVPLNSGLQMHFPFPLPPSEH